MRDKAHVPYIIRRETPDYVANEDPVEWIEEVGNPAERKTIATQRRVCETPSPHGRRRDLAAQCQYEIEES
jgi:hypothetical protein